MLRNMRQRTANVAVSVAMIGGVAIALGVVLAALNPYFGRSWQPFLDGAVYGIAAVAAVALISLWWRRHPVS